jgi:hypothetical protein
VLIELRCTPEIFVLPWWIYDQCKPIWTAWVDPYSDINDKWIKTKAKGPSLGKKSAKDNPFSFSSLMQLQMAL